MIDKIQNDGGYGYTQSIVFCEIGSLYDRTYNKELSLKLNQGNGDLAISQFQDTRIKKGSKRVVFKFDLDQPLPMSEEEISEKIQKEWGYKLR